MVLGYSEIKSKVCQKVGVHRRKSLKTTILEMTCLYDNLKATGWRVFVTREGANQGSGQLFYYFIFYFHFILSRQNTYEFKYN